MLAIILALLCFQAFTGLKVNVGKSEIVSVGEVGNIDDLGSILSCRVGSLPMKYLGMPLGAGHPLQDCIHLEPHSGEDGEEAIWLEASIFV